MANKYNDGKIYKIESMIAKLIYFGSTCISLQERFKQHKSSKISFEHGKRKHKCGSFQILDYPDCNISLVEHYPCEDKQQLLMREAFYIKNNLCTNLSIPLRTHKEWLNDNKQSMKEWVSKYRKDHSEQYKQWQKDWRGKNAEYIKEQAKLKYEINKEEISNRRKIKVICSCGSAHHRASIARHRKKCNHFLSNVGAGTNNPSIVEISEI